MPNWTLLKKKQEVSERLAELLIDEACTDMQIAWEQSDLESFPEFIEDFLKKKNSIVIQWKKTQARKFIQKAMEDGLISLGTPYDK